MCPFADVNYWLSVQISLDVDMGVDTCVCRTVGVYKGVIGCESLCM